MHKVAHTQSCLVDKGGPTSDCHWGVGQPDMHKVQQMAQIPAQDCYKVHLDAQKLYPRDRLEPDSSAA